MNQRASLTFKEPLYYEMKIGLQGIIQEDLAQKLSETNFVIFMQNMIIGFLKLL